ncbi:hypothetical protein P20480_2722 [Pseudoalteromonas sp. BSi20480]|nr:hypothetical protein P20480_2722 [Pseudoalteromonas sp. BSi20480]
MTVVATALPNINIELNSIETLTSFFIVVPLFNICLKLTGFVKSYSHQSVFVNHFSIK